jgi:biopolymer transport protein ExbD
MAIGSFQSGKRQPPLSEINVVPLVDVMLVLLVIFIITTPLLTHAVKIDLPEASSQPNLTRPEHIDLGIRADGTLFWNGERIPADAVPTRLLEAADQKPQPELHIRADRKAYYDAVAQVMSAATKAGIRRIGFVTAPAR